MTTTPTTTEMQTKMKEYGFLQGTNKYDTNDVQRELWLTKETKVVYAIHININSLAPKRKQQFKDQIM